MASIQFTVKRLSANHKYVTKLVDYDAEHPKWDTEYPLTAQQCKNSKESYDMTQGWLRKGKDGSCFCDMCAKKFGEVHRPTCLFSGGIVGNLGNLEPADEEEEVVSSSVCVIA